jgi:hypothetical protein
VEQGSRKKTNSPAWKQWEFESKKFSENFLNNTNNAKKYRFCKVAL